jgi:hypothetical protein
MLGVGKLAGMVRYNSHGGINLLRDALAGSGGARVPHILLRMLRALCSDLTHHDAARNDFDHHAGK